MSWAIPRTLSDPADRPFRYAIETIPHDLAYTLLEGSVVTGRSTTGCWDLGTYTVRFFSVAFSSLDVVLTPFLCSQIHETKSKEEPKQKLRDKGWNDSETEPREQESPYQEDLRQEDLFRDGSSFFSSPFSSPSPARYTSLTPTLVQPTTARRSCPFPPSKEDQEWVKPKTTVSIEALSSSSMASGFAVCAFSLFASRRTSRNHPGARSLPFPFVFLATSSRRLCD